MPFSTKEMICNANARCDYQSPNSDMVLVGIKNGKAYVARRYGNYIGAAISYGKP